MKNIFTVTLYTELVHAAVSFGLVKLKYSIILEKQIFPYASLYAKKERVAPAHSWVLLGL